MALHGKGHGESMKPTPVDMKLYRARKDVCNFILCTVVLPGITLRLRNLQTTFSCHFLETLTTE